MKIKEVCLKTGLTDRTVRFYIEEGLIAPAYAENYLGRRAFDFSEADVATLSDIAVLREFDFSVEEIRRILQDPQSSREVIAAVKERTAHRLSESHRHAEALEALSTERAYTLSELAESLTPTEELPPPVDTGRVRVWRRTLEILRAIATLAVILLPPVLGVTFFLFAYGRCTHPVVEPLLLLLGILLCLPSAFALVSFPVPHIRRWIPTRVLVAVCLCAIPLTALVSLGCVAECTHTWSEFSTEVAASCTERGSARRRCLRCSAEERVTTDPTGHASVTDAAVAPTCAAEGLSEGSHCAACGEVFVAQTALERLPHAPTEVPEVQPTCTERGLRGGVICTVCGETLVLPTSTEPLGHDVIRTEAVTPTCTTRGLSAGEHCARCNVRLIPQTVLSPLGHVPLELPPRAPTCTEDGYSEELICEREGCGMTLRPAEPLEATGHTPVTEGGVAPTCTKEGLSGVTRCSTCDTVLAEATVLPPAHSALVRQEGRPATCTQIGKVGYDYCADCGVQVGEGGDYLPMLPHDEYLVESVDATCDTDGYRRHACRSCGRERLEWVECPDAEHVFITTPQFGDGKCSVCGLVVCQRGNADGSLSGGNSFVKYYVTGATDAGDDFLRTLVIYGTGPMPDYPDPPVWASSALNIGAVVIKRGVTAIGRHAFDETEDANVYTRVKSFTVEDPTLSLSSMEGIKCSVTWGNDLCDRRAGSAYINYLLGEPSPFLVYALADLDGDGGEELIVRRGETASYVKEYYYHCNSYGAVVPFYPWEGVDTSALPFFDRSDRSGFLATVA